MIPRSFMFLFLPMEESGNLPFLLKISARLIAVIPRASKIRVSRKTVMSYTLNTCIPGAMDDP
jgi:hypothetical protein